MAIDNHPSHVGVCVADPDGTRIELMRIQAGHDWQ